MENHPANEFRNWTVLSLQERARGLGLNYQGLSKEPLIDLLVSASQVTSSQVANGHAPETAALTTKSQWLVWYEEEMAALGSIVTQEYQLEAANMAKQRQAAMEAERGQNITWGESRRNRETLRVTRKEFKPFNEETGDVEGFFQDFEQQCALLDVPTSDWMRVLVGLLEGGAAEAYRTLDAQRNRDYDIVKQTILDYYAVTPDSHRAQFRDLPCTAGGSFRMYAHKMSRACQRWLEAESAFTVDDILQAFLKEQFYTKCPQEIREWVRERKPPTLNGAAALADEALTIKPQWRRLLDNKPQSNPAPRPPPVIYGPQPIRRPMTTMPTNPGAPQFRPRYGGISERKCYGCGQPGHLQSSCPSRNRRELRPFPPPPGHLVHSILPEEEFPPPPPEWTTEPCITETPPGLYGIQSLAKSYPEQRQRHLQDVFIDGYKVTGFRDTGAFLTIADPRVVRPEAIHQGPGIPIALAGGTRKYIQKAAVHLDYGYGERLCWIGVMGGLPADVLLGNDIGELQCHFVGAVTRNQAAQAQRISDFTVEQHPGPPTELVRATSTASTLRDFWDREEFRQEIEGDPTLAAIKLRAETGQEGENGDRITRDKGLYYRYVEARGGVNPEATTRQLIVPQKYRLQLLQLAHDIPLSGHQGRKRTEKRITHNFYWPGVSQSVVRYCRTCDVCQRMRHPGARHKVPLQSLPIIEEPFQRVAVDIIGPLAHPSRTGKRFILTVVDYATRYPEAVALSSITAMKVAEALVTIFTRVGFPSEILSDQGTQFMSDLVQSLWHTCGVRAIRTTPYHPQTNGLCERFNGTLKNMLRAFADTERDWEQYLPHLLFAYREVPQESTGFSPFELLYGRKVRGPLTLLKEYWEGEITDTGVPVIPYVLEFRDRLTRLTTLAKEHLQQAQYRQKTWYDRKARTREFIEGQQVLMINAVPANKLQATWDGPYRVIRKLNDTNYVIAMDPSGRRQKTVHINMLKEYHDRSLPVLAICCPPSDKEGDDSLPDLLHLSRAGGTLNQVPLGLHLSDIQKDDILALLGPRASAFSSAPGRTTLTSHHVETQGQRPIQQAPYRVPEAVRDMIKSELADMKQLGIIRPSQSPWASPVVLVPKKDGTTRFCVDYRRLNDATKSDAYPMPRIDDLLDRLASARFVTTLDLSKGYWQIPLTENARERSAFITPFGLFEFLGMPFGMKNAPATFQRLVDRLLEQCQDFACAYLDDIAIFSTSWEEHLKHLGIVLDHILAAGLTIRPDKCQLGMAEVQYLGHRVGGGTLRPEPAKVEAISNWPTPQTKKQVLAFLGTASYYRKFVSHFSALAKPLNDLTRKNMPRMVKWAPACEEAFTALKTALTTAPVLAAPDYKRRFLVQTDASTYGIGAVLSQIDAAGHEHPVAFISRKLLDREVAYATIEKECLAIVWALKKLQPYLYGRDFTIVTDHNPLTWLNRVSGDNGRLLRWSLSLQPYSFSIQYKRGSQHQNADGLSRQEEP
ncbi:uncharacterized protein LOC142662718 [Rhinoderma darwinii]|uniref:uncharacterized protein LOC142662718 n=1 Tax=Rhinoderma darwinii TaxID=43563 RepID=UPI003F66B31A